MLGRLRYTGSRWRWFVLVLLCLLGGSLLLLTAWPMYRDRLQREEALRLFQARHFRQAEPLLRKILERQPDDSETVKALAQIFLAGEAPASAEPFLRRWAELRPKEVEPWNRLLELYRRQKKYEAARLAAREILQREPDNPAVQRRFAELCVSSGHFEEAEPALRRCLQQQPNERRLLLLLAEVQHKRGHRDEADAIIERLLANDPSDPAVLMTAGIVYRETGRVEQAIPLLEKVLSRDPSRARTACYQLTLALEQAGRHDEASKVAERLRYLQESQVLRELLPSQPNNLEVKMRLAKLLLSHGETEEGTRLLNEVLTQHPEYPPAQQLRARYRSK